MGISALRNRKVMSNLQKDRKKYKKCVPEIFAVPEETVRE